MSLSPIPVHRRHSYTAAELALADAGRPDLARRSANARREPGHSFTGSRLRPLAELLTDADRAMIGLGLETLEDIAKTDAPRAKAMVAGEARRAA